MSTILVLCHDDRAEEVLFGLPLQRVVDVAIQVVDMPILPCVGTLVRRNSKAAVLEKIADADKVGLNHLFHAETYLLNAISTIIGRIPSHPATKSQTQC